VYTIRKLIKRPKPNKRAVEPLMMMMMVIIIIIGRIRRIHSRGPSQIAPTLDHHG
jgi:hypothetical protein